jgi:hypothetical protein
MDMRVLNCRPKVWSVRCRGWGTGLRIEAIVAFTQRDPPYCMRTAGITGKSGWHSTAPAPSDAGSTPSSPVGLSTQEVGFRF